MGCFGAVWGGLESFNGPGPKRLGFFLISSKNIFDILTRPSGKLSAFCVLFLIHFVNLRLLAESIAPWHAPSTVISSKITFEGKRDL